MVIVISFYITIELSNGHILLHYNVLYVFENLCAMSSAAVMGGYLLLPSMHSTRVLLSGCTKNAMDCLTLPLNASSDGTSTLWG